MTIESQIKLEFSANRCWTNKTKTTIGFDRKLRRQKWRDLVVFGRIRHIWRRSSCENVEFLFSILFVIFFYFFGFQVFCSLIVRRGCLFVLRTNTIVFQITGHLSCWQLYRIDNIHTYPTVVCRRSHTHTHTRTHTHGRIHTRTDGRGVGLQL